MITYKHSFTNDSFNYCFFAIDRGLDRFTHIRMYTNRALYVSKRPIESPREVKV